MDFKRTHHTHHHQHQHQGHQSFSYASRTSAPGGGTHVGGYQPGTFVAAHHHPQQQHSRAFKTNDGHNGARSPLNLTHSFRNLLKVQGDMATERANGFQKLSQLRDLMLSRISTIANNLLKDEVIESLIELLKEKKSEEEHVPEDSHKDNGSEEMEAVKANPKVSGVTNGLKEIKSRWRIHVQDAVSSICEETRVYAMREDSFMGTIFGKERGVEKHFAEFFSEAERQMMDYEKKIRSDQYTQMMSRLRTAEREMAIREQKNLQLEDALKIVSERNEKTMAELQQVNADHQFEKLQLYHHVELCKANAKTVALKELKKICEWKRCGCGRDYEDLYNDIKTNFNAAYIFSGNVGQEMLGLGLGKLKDIPDMKEMSCASSWIYPAIQPQIAAAFINSSPMAISDGSFVPSEEAETKGTILNDLRDRCDELQSKVSPNYEEMRNMITKTVCHFKSGGFRVCEEMKAKQYVSSLFYCEEDDLMPSKHGKVFSTGTGETVEQATKDSLERALDQINRFKASTTESPAEMGVTYIMRAPKESITGKLDSETIRMTLLRSYCSERVDPTIRNVQCLQEAYLYQNQVHAKEKYMADWKIHIRAEDSLQVGIKEKLKHILRSLTDSHVSDFIDQRSHKEMRKHIKSK